eukprot:CAMPEP_0170455478 /NCGR_PEP_ID=MMETSP0123-20130129/3432_1 /TAXON_ID=182087 /ORGANISM="Favella ehrenbergii, Strain Fehren 1" /LENGTH=116 /DNA_ID=CAMNT_0010718635 /DNA_START=417 /DNA_END=766 /DNA_ORIENTATION=-
MVEPEKGDSLDALYEYDGEKYAVCSDFFSSKGQTLILANGIKGSIVGINFVMKSIIVKLVTWIGYDTHSEVMTKITNAVYYVLFFNSGLLLLLTDANLSDVSPTLGVIFQGSYYDY